MPQQADLTDSRKIRPAPREDGAGAPGGASRWPEPGAGSAGRGAARRRLGARKLRDLSADDVDRWLSDKAQSLSTRSLRETRSVLKRAVTRAQARDKVKRNVVLLCEVPKGQQGRPSKSLTLSQAEVLLAAAQDNAMHAYIVLSLLIGARTEELRALTWSHVDLDGKPAATADQLAHHRSWCGGPYEQGRHQDQEITADVGASSEMRRRAAGPSSPSGTGKADGWPQVAGQRSGVPLRSRHRVGRLAHAAQLPQGCRVCRARSPVDAQRAEAQLCLAAL